MLQRATQWLRIALPFLLLCALISPPPLRNDAAAFIPAETLHGVFPPPPPTYPNPNDWTQRPLCELSNQAQAIVWRTSARVGVAVADLVQGRLWTGGDANPFALHSVAKPPIAWMTLAAAEARGETLSPQLAQHLRQMIIWSNNDAVPILLSYAGGLPALHDFYIALNLRGLVAHFSHFSWGRTAGAPADIAAAYAQLATAAAFSPAVRNQGFALLQAVRPEQRWGASTPPAALAGWSALVKTGQFAIEGEGLRVNSAAIWLDQWRRPRYVVAIMSAEHRYWGRAIEHSNQIGAALAAAISARENNAVDPATACAPRNASPAPIPPSERNTRLPQMP